MSDLPFAFDEIGYWSELKLDIVEQYGAAYTRTFANFPNLKKFYIDGFSGAGIHLSKTTGTPIEGSPTRALKVTPPFDGFCFIDLNTNKTDYLRAVCGDRRDVHIHTGDSNTYLLTAILPEIQYEKYTRALCLLDPYALNLGLASDPASGAITGGRPAPQFSRHGYEPQRDLARLRESPKGRDRTHEPVLG